MKHLGNGSNRSTENTASSSTSEQNKSSGNTSADKKSKGQECLLEKFFYDQLKDIYYAEQQIIKALPKMIDSATTEELKEAFDDHLHQTHKQVKRLEKVFEKLNQKAEGKKCEAILPNRLR